MNFLSREQIVEQFTESMDQMLNKYNLEDIGVFQEEGAENHYYIGYTVRKNGAVYMIHVPCLKNNQGELAIEESNWTIETDEGHESTGYHSLEDAFNQINQGNLKH